MTNPLAATQQVNQFRYSMELFRRMNLVDPKGCPHDLAGLISHLFYTGSSAFAFAVLLRDGLFDSIVASAPDEQTCHLVSLWCACELRSCSRRFHSSSQEMFAGIIDACLDSFIHTPI